MSLGVIYDVIQLRVQEETNCVSRSEIIVPAVNYRMHRVAFLLG